MRLSKAVLAVSMVLLLVAVFPGPYLIRWLAVLFLGLFLALFLFGFDIRVAVPGFGRSENVERKTDVDRAVALIEKAKKGKVARSLVEERIIEIYATLSDDYNSTYSSLLSEPNEALKVLRSEGDFLDNLERALKIVEADLNEG